MVTNRNRGSRKVRRAHWAAGAAAVCVTVLLCLSAAPAQDVKQDARPEEQPPAVAPAPAAPRSFQPGFIDAFGQWFSRSRERLNDQMRDARDTLGSLGGQATGTAQDAAGTAKDAATTIVGLPATRIVSGRERCPVASNGAPDCRTAADAVCKSKGFGSGKSLDTASAQKCPAQVWLSGRQPAEGECSVETFVTRAVCQ
ncbi:MAG: hypothetical protein QOD94_2805 [Alphaproteobacteria bacterium]|jgi:hypothetical protein|nr:hypothetical protein [Alphaproteobacteria bacterium]